MIADFIPTVTRRQERLTFAMKKRPTSGDVTYIRTLLRSADVIPSNSEDVMVLVVFIIIYLFTFSAIPEHKICIFVNIILFCLGPQICRCGVKKTDLPKSFVCNLCTFEFSIGPKYITKQKTILK